MSHPTTYDPTVTSLNWTSFVWQAQSFDYVDDGDDVSAANTNKVFVEPTYGLVDHLAYLYYKAVNENTRVNRLYTKLGTAETDSKECFGEHYLASCLDYKEALIKLDNSLFSFATSTTTSGATLSNLLLRLGSGYGTGPDLPVFSGAGVTGGLITGTDRVHDAIQKICNQAYSSDVDLDALTIRVNNILSNGGVGFDVANSGTNPNYAYTSGGAVIEDGDTFLVAIGKLATDRDTQVDRIDRCEDIIGKAGATATDGVATFSEYVDGNFGATLVSSTGLTPVLITPEQGLGDEGTHHQAIILHDNFIQASLRHEDARDFTLLRTQLIPGVVVPTGKVGIGYYDTINVLFKKTDEGNTDAILDYRNRKITATVTNQLWVSGQIDLTTSNKLRTSGGGFNSTYVWLDPVYDSDDPDTDFSFYANAGDDVAFPGTGTLIQLATFRTWVLLGVAGNGTLAGRIVCRFNNTLGTLYGVRVLFKNT